MDNVQDFKFERILLILLPVFASLSPVKVDCQSHLLVIALVSTKSA